MSSYSSALGPIHMRYLQVDPRTFMYSLAVPDAQSVAVISALGAVIAVTTLVLLVITLWLGYRVYIQGKKTIEKQKQGKQS